MEHLVNNYLIHTMSRYDFAQDPLQMLQDTRQMLLDICDAADKAKALAQEKADAAFAQQLILEDTRIAALQTKTPEATEQEAQQVAQDGIFAATLMPKPVSSSSKQNEFTTVGPRRRSQH